MAQHSVKPPPSASSSSLIQSQVDRLRDLYRIALNQPNPEQALADLEANPGVRKIFQPSQMAAIRKQATDLVSPIPTAKESVPTHKPMPMPPVDQSTTVKLPPDVELKETESNEFEKIEDLNLAEKGRRIEEAYKLNGLKVEFVMATDGLRHDRFVFKKIPITKYGAFDGLKQEALSHAGYDPTLDLIFRPLPHNQFEIQIPRPRETWKVLRFIHSIPGGKEALLGFGQHNDQVKCLQSIRQSIWSERAYHPHPSTPLRSIVGQDIDGKPIWVNHNGNTLFLGNPNSGKSIGIDVMLSYWFIVMPPEWLQIAAMDFKEGLTLKNYEGMPHFWKGYPVVTSKNKNTVEELFYELLQEKERRGNDFAAAGVANLSEFNEVYPGECRPWLPVVIEELSVLPRILGADDHKMILGQMLREWRAAGMPIISTTQYASEDMGLGPSQRVFDSIICFKTSESAAKLAFGVADNTAIKIASRLSGSGDLLVMQDGQFTRGQGFLIDRPLRNNLKSTWSKQYAIKAAAKNPFESLDFVAPQESLPSAAAVPSLLESDGDRPKWERLQKLLRVKPKASQNEQLRAVFGEQYDTPNKAHAGGNFYSNIAELNRLKAKYGAVDD